MARSFSRIHRLSATLAVILVAVAAAAPLPAQAQARQNASTQTETPLMRQFNSAEEKLREQRFAEAGKEYEALLSQHGNSLGTEERAVVLVRLSNCYIQQRSWEKAEKVLLEFLDKSKYPNGTGDKLDPQNNFRNPAEISLAEVYINQEKWDPAIAILQRLSRGTNLTTEEQINSTIALSNLFARKSEKEPKAEANKLLLQGIALLKPIVAQKNFGVPEVKAAGDQLITLYTKVGAVQDAKALQDDIEAAIKGSPVDRVKGSFQRLSIGDTLFQQAELEGDPLRKTELYRQSLTNYQEVLRSNAVEAMIEQAIDIKTKEVEALTKRYPQPNEAQAEEIEKATKEKDYLSTVSTKFKESKDYDAFISYRIALCLLELKRPWEAYIAFRDIFDHNPKFERADVAYYYYIAALRAIHRDEEAQEVCRKFLEDYPESQVLGQVAVQLGEISYEQGDYANAVKQFRWARSNVKSLEKTYQEWIDSYIVSSLFSDVEWKAALEGINDFIAKYPNSRQMEQMLYMRGLCYFFQGVFKETIESFDAYLTKYPEGRFRPDARYRLAIMRYGRQPDPNTPEQRELQVKDVIQRCESWLTDYQNPPPSLRFDVTRQRPEIYTLIGDCYIALSDSRSAQNTSVRKAQNLAKAIDYYVLAAKNAEHNPDALDYALRELNKRLPAQGEWAKLLDVYVTLYNWDPDSSKALAYLYQIIRASERLGKTEEQKRATLAKANVTTIPDEYITKSAEGILADAIVHNINNPKKESVEQLISELARRLARKARMQARNGGGEIPNTEAEIAGLLNLNQSASLIAQARGYYTRAELARLLRDENKRKENLRRIATIFKAEELSPIILGVTGDMLFESGEKAKALEYYQYILDHFRSSDYADFGFAGKAQILVEEDKSAQALILVNEALDNNISFHKEKELFLLKAHALIETDQLTEAKQVLDAIASNRAWRGEATAYSLYYLGQIEEKKGNTNEAINYYRRCYLAWKKHGNVTAKAYLRTAQLFQKKGDIDGVKGTLRDMLSEDNPASKAPEAIQARELLNQQP